MSRGDRVDPEGEFDGSKGIRSERGSRHFMLGWAACGGCSSRAAGRSSSVGKGPVLSCWGVIDPEVVSRFSTGDPDAVRAVYREYGGLVFAVAFKLLGDRGLAEEAAQQAFVAAWRASESFDVGRDLAPWLATIARRAAIDIGRREARRRHQSLDQTEARAAEVVGLPDSVERAYEVWEVRRAIEQLAPDEAALIRLQHFEGLTHAEIAQRLAVPVGTVKSRSFRAHRRLAGLLGHLQGDVTEPSGADRRTRWQEETPR